MQPFNGISESISLSGSRKMCRNNAAIYGIIVLQNHLYDIIHRQQTKRNAQEEAIMGCTTAPDEKTLAPAWGPRKDRTYELVSKVAYLIGVPLRIFENEHEPPKLELYDQLERDKNARIIRSLCIIRTAIERNYKKSMIRSAWNTVGCSPCRSSFLLPASSSFQMTALISSKNPARNSAIM